MSRRLTTRQRSRLTRALPLALILCLAPSGCGSHSSSTAQPPSASADVPASTATGSPHAGGSRAAQKTVAATFTEFFAGTTPADRKITLVQDGQGFAPVINAQAGGVMSQGTTVKVSGVSLASPSRANVRYTILLGGTPALKDQTGVALKQHGHWVVGAATFCQLLTLEQSAPPLCKKVS